MIFHYHHSRNYYDDTFYCKQDIVVVVYTNIIHTVSRSTHSYIPYSFSQPYF